MQGWSSSCRSIWKRDLRLQPRGEVDGTSIKRSKRVAERVLIRGGAPYKSLEQSARALFFERDLWPATSCVRELQRYHHA